MDNEWHIRFQFHKGAIRTHDFDFLPSFLPEFQFHKGAIRTEQNQQRNKTLIYFNSIKVRLEPPARFRAAAGSRFQFHKGAIRTKDRHTKPSL